MQWLAFDIGGASIKVADGQGYAVLQSFALWRNPDQLPHMLRRLLAESPGCERLAVTMTGELADCYESKAAGVRAILSAVHEAADGRHVRVYLSDGRLVTPPVAQRVPQLAAAANWHALARFVGRFVTGGTAILLDIGSTTTDMIPLVAGVPQPRGSTDTQRLQHGELLYTGVKRNPLCGVAQTAVYRGSNLPLAQEYFATIGDVYIILGAVAEDPTSTDTADGRPATKRFARARLARMVCADAEEFNHRDAVTLSQSVADQQLDQITARLHDVSACLPNPPQSVIVCGSGEFLARRAAERLTDKPSILSLTDELSSAASVAAPAHALAVLAMETGK
jgi:probable H4MPT-linked C1 transfer pathway protein